jgi:hypothetical protein
VQDGFAVGGGELLGVPLGLADGVPEPEALADGLAEDAVGVGQVGFTATVNVIVVEGS